MGEFGDYIQRRNKKVGLISSGLAGIASGLLKVPEGITSLGAELIDLGLGTDTAAEVEDFFDKVNVFEDTAQSRFTGKLTSVLTQFGIGGAAGVRLGAKLADKAFGAAKAGKYLTPKRLLTTLGGGALGEAVVATDTPEVSFLARPVTTEGREAAFDKLANRALLGLESAAIASVPLGGVALFKNAQQRALSNQVFDIQKQGKQSLFDRMLIGLSKQGHLSKEGFNLYRDFITKRRGELVKAKQTSETLSRVIDDIGKEAFTTDKKGFDIFKKNLFKALGRNEQSVDEVLASVKGADGNVARAKELIKYGQGQIQNLATDLYGFYTKKALQTAPDGSARYAIPKDLEEFFSAVKNTAEKESDYYLGNFYKFFERFKGGKYAGWKPLDSATDELYEFVLDVSKSRQQKKLNRIPTLQKRFDTLTEAKLKLDKEYRAALNAGNSRKAKDIKLRQDDIIKKINRTSDTLVGLKQSTSKYAQPTKEEALQTLKILQEHSDATVTKMQDATKPGSKFIPQNITVADIEKFYKRKIKSDAAGAQKIKNALGIIEDPAEALFLSQQKLINMAVKNKFLDDVAELGQKEGWILEGTGDALRQPASPQKLVKIGIDNKDIDAILPNELVGKWTTPYIAKQLGLSAERLDGNFNLRLIEGLWNYALVLPKAVSSLAKTVLNPPTQMRNFIAGGFFAANSGNMKTFGKILANPIGKESKKAFGTAFQPTFFRKLFNKEPLTPAEIEEYSKLTERGIFNTSVRVNEIRDAFSNEIKGVPDFFNNLAQGNVPIAKLLFGLKQGLQGFENVYQASDDFYKLVTYVGETGKAREVIDVLKKQGMNVENFTGPEFRETIESLIGRKLDFVDELGVPKMGAEQRAKFFDELSEEIAAHVARNAVPNYDYVGQTVRGLRKMPIGNFMSFPSEIIRTSLYNAERGLLERRLGKQLGIKTLEDIGTGRLVSQLATTAAVPMMSSLGTRSIFGYTQEQADAIKEFVPPWSKNSTLLYLPRDKDGNARYIDFSHTMPYDLVTRPIRTLFANLGKLDRGEISIGEAITGSFVEATSELFSPFIDPAIYANAVGDITSRGGQTKEGKRIFNQADPALEKASKASIHVLNSLTPGFAQLSLSGGIKGTDPLQKLGLSAAAFITGNERFNTDEYGRKFNPITDIAGLTGLKPNVVDPKESMKYQVSGFQDQVRNATASFTSEILRGKPKPVSDIVTEYTQTQSSRFDAYQNMYKKVKAAQTLGLTDKEVLKTFGDRITKKDKIALLSGKFRPYTPSENVLFKAAENASQARLPNTLNEAFPSLLNIANEFNGYSLEAQNPFVSAFVPQAQSPFANRPTPTAPANVRIATSGNVFAEQRAEEQAKKYAALFPTDISGISIASRSNK